MYKGEKKQREITHISKLFLKYTHILKPPQKSIIKASIEVVKDIYDIDLNENNCTYQTNTKVLILHIPGIMKSELLLNKSTLLSEIAKKVGAKNAPKNIL